MTHAQGTTDRATRGHGYRSTPREAAAASRLLLSVEEAAERLGIRRTLMYELVMSGEVRSIHVGRLRRVPSQALEAFVARRLAETEDPQPAIPNAG